MNIPNNLQHFRAFPVLYGDNNPAFICLLKGYRGVMLRPFTWVTNMTLQGPLSMHQVPTLKPFNAEGIQRSVEELVGASQPQDAEIQECFRQMAVEYLEERRQRLDDKGVLYRNSSEFYQDAVWASRPDIGSGATISALNAASAGSGIQLLTAPAGFFEASRKAPAWSWPQWVPVGGMDTLLKQFLTTRKPLTMDQGKDPRVWDRAHDKRRVATGKSRLMYLVEEAHKLQPSGMPRSYIPPFPLAEYSATGFARLSQDKQEQVVALCHTWFSWYQLCLHCFNAEDELQDECFEDDLHRACIRYYHKDGELMDGAPIANTLEELQQTVLDIQAKGFSNI